MLHSPQQTGGGLERSWHRAVIADISLMQPAVIPLGKSCTRSNFGLTADVICCDPLIALWCLSQDMQDIYHLLSMWLDEELQMLESALSAQPGKEETMR